MTEMTRTVFEKYQVRKTKKQKAAFVEYVRTVATAQGYTCTTEKGWLGANNIVVGDPTAAGVVYTAHYDTCARLPFPNFITPKNVLIYLLYQFAVVGLFMLVPAVAVLLLTVLVLTLMGVDIPTTVAVSIGAEYVTLVTMLLLLVAGPANKHTANDNTSGVTTLLDIMNCMPQELQGQVAFVFFDLEEAGLFGSLGFYSKHRREMKNKLLLNFDCVSDGEHMLFAVKKKAKTYLPAIEAAFPDGGDVQVEIATKGVFYPSDQEMFPCGVGVAALKQTKWTKTLYMNRIHTNRDTVYREENIAFLADGAVRLAELVSGSTKTATSQCAEE